MAFDDLSPAQARDLLEQRPDIKVLDVRTQPEYERYHLAGALLVPIQEIQERVGELDPGASWLVICEHGVRSVMACEFLSHLGFSKLSNLAGGMARWVGENLPVE